MKLLIDISVGDGEHCGACPLNEIADICPLFDEVIYDPKWGYKARRCASCLAAEAEYKNRFGWKWTGMPEMTGLSEKELDEMVENRAKEIVRLAFEMSREGTV
ncbi:MAG: hypothetical protein PHS57_10525 [Alphaproteobacteria bacterium]|nr:hypothetical protein [Alphaproteobacteria bacterium]